MTGRRTTLSRRGGMSSVRSGAKRRGEAKFESSPSRNVKRQRPTKAASSGRSTGKGAARGKTERSQVPSKRGASGATQAGAGTKGSAAITTDHEMIRKWVEDRGGHPATVERTLKGKQDAGVLRVDFPGYSGNATLKPVTWKQWFKIFDDRRLAFLHQDKTGKGKLSRFNKLICRPN